MKAKLKLVAKNAGPLVAAILVANFLNFIFNAFLARSLTVEDFGFVALLNTFAMILLVGSGALMQVTSFQVARVGDDQEKVMRNYRAIRNNTQWSAGLLAIGWLMMSSLLMHFFHAPHILGVIVFSPMIWLGLMSGVCRGYIQGRLRFSLVGFLFLGEAAAKLLIAVLLVRMGLHSLVYLALPVSVALAWLASVYAVRRLTPISVSSASEHERFPWALLGGYLIAGLATMSFLSTDLVLAKHYLSEANAGLYAILSLSGKMVYFLGSLLSGFMLPMLGRAEASGSNPRRTYWLMYAVTAVLVLTGFVAFGPLGYIAAPILFGSSSKAILPFLTHYSAGIALFTLANVTVAYHVAKKRFIFPAMSLAFAIFMAVEVVMHHTSIAAISNAVWLAGITSFVVITCADLVVASRLVRSRAQSSDKAQTKKRILILNWRDTRHAQSGGAEVYIHELAMRWCESGNEVTLFCGSDGKSPRHEVIDGVKIIRRGSFYMTYIWAFIYYQTRFRGKFDVIVDCHNGIPFFASLYASEPVFCVVHHVHQAVFARFLNKPMAKIAGFLEKSVMPWAYRNNQFLTVSKSSKEAMTDSLGIPPETIKVIHSGVDLDILTPGDKTEYPSILYVGRLKAYKSIDTLLRAFVRVRVGCPDARLVIAGSGDDESRLKSIATKLKINDFVSFQGRVTEKQKVRLLQRAWVFVNPSLLEGWGMTTIEANACGTPVIASDVPGLRDSVNSPAAGYLVEYGDSDAFARKIRLVLTDEAHRLKLSTGAKAWAHNFDWQTSASAFLEVIS